MQYVRTFVNPPTQTLSITGDNATNNDALVAALAELLDSYDKRNRVRCFLHIVNLVSRSFLSPFDVKKKKRKDGTEVEEEEEEEDWAPDEADLRELARDLELEESEMADEEDGQTLEEDVDVEIDAMESMSEDEKAQLRATCRPVKFMLVKVHILVRTSISLTL